MFHTAHCLWAANLPGGANCADCRPLDFARDKPLDSACGNPPCRQHRIRLRDRNGEDHAVTVDPCGRNTVFASRPRTAGGSLPELVRAGVRHFRVELLEESAEEARRLISLGQAQRIQWRP
jgi:putative protease